MYDCVIIGAGPAGVSAAIYTARADLSTLVLGDFTKGQLYSSHVIANYFGFPEDINGPDLAQLGINQAKRFGAEFKENEAVDIIQEDDHFIVRIDTKETIEAKYVIISTGMTYVASGISKEKDFIGKGLSYCVTCDGAFYRDKKVFVVGNGSFAAEEALGLKTFTSDITIVNQDKKWDISDEFTEELKKQNIAQKEGKITEIVTGENGMLCAVKLADGSEEAVEGLFVAVGTAGPTSFASKLGLEMNGQFIMVDDNSKTNIDGMYAAGNCTGANAQVATSVGMGCNAAVDIIKNARGQKTYVDYH